MTSQQTLTEANKARLRRGFEEGMNQKKLDVFDELLAPNYVNYNMLAPAPGPAGFKQVMQMFLTAFPDMHITIEDEFGEGDKVGTRGYFTGTHQGEFMGIPATNKPVKVAYIDLWRMENGLCVENWVQMDMLGLMQQLGVVPPSGQAK
jgi:predicted ester cyclase